MRSTFPSFLPWGATAHPPRSELEGKKLISFVANEVACTALTKGTADANVACVLSYSLRSTAARRNLLISRGAFRLGSTRRTLRPWDRGRRLRCQAEGNLRKIAHFRKIANFRRGRCSEKNESSLPFPPCVLPVVRKSFKIASFNTDKALVARAGRHQASKERRQSKLLAASGEGDDVT